ncbi:hypothetical protein C4A77_13165 [Brevibacillus laterosporus]|uniref:Uncharacterized protein n=1 Tax=Brevibacillus laterosporus TaxID=1465 RepID=A0AAP8QDB4_BRELA|nr:hypothetical protein C4A77_13165 [Brevibacillus laterosporus]
MQSPLHVLRLYVKYAPLVGYYAHGRKSWIFSFIHCRKIFLQTRSTSKKIKKVQEQEMITLLLHFF